MVAKGLKLSQPLEMVAKGWTLVVSAPEVVAKGWILVILALQVAKGWILVVLALEKVAKGWKLPPCPCGCPPARSPLPSVQFPRG